MVFTASMLLESDPMQPIKGRRPDGPVALAMLRKYFATFYISCGL